MMITLRALAEVFARLPAEERAHMIAWHGELCVARDRSAWAQAMGDPPVADPPLPAALEARLSAPGLAETMRSTREASPADVAACLAALEEGTVSGDEIARLDVASGAYERFYAIRAGDVVVDAGAHVGHFAEHACTKVGPAGRVIAFEPAARNLHHLDRRLAAHDNAVIFPRALSHDATDRTLHLSVVSSLHSFRPVSFETCEVNVECMPLDALSLGLCHFVKMDVEGAEVDALEGARKTLARHHPHLAIEVHPDTGEHVAALLRQLGYKVYGAEAERVFSAFPELDFVPPVIGMLWGVPS